MTHCFANHSEYNPLVSATFRDTASALPADMDAQTTQATHVRAAGVPKDRLARRKTPGGIHGGPTAIEVAEDAPDGDDEQEVG